MAKVLSDTPEFVDGFVETCYNKGFTELQAAELLKTAARLELVEVKDPDFMEGMAKAAAPGVGYGAKLAKGLGFPWKIPIGPQQALGVGALAAGAAIPNFYRPAPFETDEGALSGAGKGALAGGALGVGLGALSILGKKGKGGHSFLRRFFSDANPSPRHYVDMPTGGKVRGGFDFAPHAPLRAAAKALSQPEVLTGARRGIIYGGLAGLGMGLKDGIGGGGFSGMNYGSAPYAPGGGAAGGSSSSSSGSGSIYSVPGTLRSTYSSGSYQSPSAAGAAGAAGAVSGAGVVGSMRAAQNRVKEIDGRIAAMRKEVDAARTSNDPNSLLRAHDKQREIRRLEKTKDMETRSMNKYVSMAAKEQAKYQSAAAHDFGLATRRQNDADKNFKRQMSVLNADGDHWYSGAWTGPIAEKLLNSRERAGMYADDTTRHEDVRNKAQEAMSRSF